MLHVQTDLMAHWTFLFEITVPPGLDIVSRVSIVGKSRENAAVPICLQERAE